MLTAKSRCSWAWRKLAANIQRANSIGHFLEATLLAATAAQQRYQVLSSSVGGQDSAYIRIGYGGIDYGNTWHPESGWIDVKPKAELIRAARKLETNSFILAKSWCSGAVRSAYLSLTEAQICG